MHPRGSVSSWSEPKMRRSLTFSIAFAALAASVFAQRGPTGVRTIATVRELHDVMISPSSDAVFDAATNPPTEAKGWLAARNQALLLAESANPLMVGSRLREPRTSVEES